MIRYAVATVLLLYFLGADFFHDYRPRMVGDQLAMFHREVNRGVWNIVGPGVRYFSPEPQEEEKKNA